MQPALRRKMILTNAIDDLPIVQNLTARSFFDGLRQSDPLVFLIFDDFIGIYGIYPAISYFLSN